MKTSEVILSGKYDGIIPARLKNMISGTENPTPSEIKKLIENVNNMLETNDEVRRIKTFVAKQLQDILDELNSSTHAGSLKYYTNLLQDPVSNRNKVTLQPSQNKNFEADLKDLVEIINPNTFSANVDVSRFTKVS